MRRREGRRVLDAQRPCQQVDAFVAPGELSDVGDRRVVVAHERLLAWRQVLEAQRQLCADLGRRQRIARVQRLRAHGHGQQRGRAREGVRGRARRELRVADDGRQVRQRAQAAPLELRRRPLLAGLRVGRVRQHRRRIDRRRPARREHAPARVAHRPVRQEQDGVGGLGPAREVVERDVGHREAELVADAPDVLAHGEDGRRHGAAVGGQHVAREAVQVLCKFRVAAVATRVQRMREAQRRRLPCGGVGVHQRAGDRLGGQRVSQETSKAGQQDPVA